MIVHNKQHKDSLLRKQARKATKGGHPKLINLPRNWAHQALSYMDLGELTIRLFVEVSEIVLVWWLLDNLLLGLNNIILISIAFIMVHTWNWVTNGLFWAVIIFTFPGLRNPGPMKTVTYLNHMRHRLASSDCITGIALYGSLTRKAWHDRSDIDIRFLRKPGAKSLLCAAALTMSERFRAFINKQPMDLFLADDVDFLKKMRSDEIPIFTICRDERLQILYPGCTEQEVQLTDLLG